MQQFSDTQQEEKTTGSDQKTEATGSALEARRTLPSFGTHLQEAFRVIRERGATVAGYYVFLLCISLVGWLFPFFLAAGYVSMSSSSTLGIYLVVFPIFVVILNLWGHIGLLRALLSDPVSASFTKSFRAVGKAVLPFIGLMVISSLTIMGGTALFVIPGIILAIFFSLSAFVLLDKRWTGWKALIGSREYLRGYTGSAALRIIGVLVIAFVAQVIVGVVLSVMFSAEEMKQPATNAWYVSNIVYSVVLLGIMIYNFAFLSRLYAYLIEIKGDISDRVEKTDKKWYIILLVLGVVALITTVIIYVIRNPLSLMVLSQLFSLFIN